jgi:arsenate reductase
MAEALLRKHGANTYEVYSAGIQPRSIDPLTIQVMQEAGCDMSHACSKDYNELAGKLPFSLVVIVCADLQSLYTFPRGSSMQFNWNFCDTASFQPQGESRLAFFRDIRDQIELRVVQFLADIAAQPNRS